MLTFKRIAIAVNLASGLFCFLTGNNLIGLVNVTVANVLIWTE